MRNGLMARCLTAVCSTLVLGLAMAPRAVAFSETGAAWQSDWQMNNCGLRDRSTTCREHFFMTNAFLARSGWRDAATAAAGYWDLWDAGRGTYALYFDYDSRTVPGNTGVQLDAVDLGGRHADGVLPLGQATWSYFLDPCCPYQLVSGRIQMTTNSAAVWWTDTACCTPSSQYDFVEATIHELGHTVGLNHPVQGPYSWAVMQCFMAGGEQERVMTDDINGETYTLRRTNGPPGASPC